MIDWAHGAPTLLAAFLASFVEFVEALTVVLAVGAVRGWRGALGGTVLALLVLGLLVAVLGRAITVIPHRLILLGLGTLLLLFGMRWLRKAILRAAGAIALHDESVAFARQTQALLSHGHPVRGWDRMALGTSFQITMVEGIEVVFIVIAMSSGRGLLVPAIVGAAAAMTVVVLLGLILHRPLAMIPENTLKFTVGLLLCAFGTFWLGEGMGIEWPGADWSLLWLAGGYLAAALTLVGTCRYRMARSAQVAGDLHEAA